MTFKATTPRIPTFLVLGAEKCGTTSLHYYLHQHPDICVSWPKEPVFFEAHFERGLDWYWESYFSHWSGERAVGEARHRNLYLPYVPSRIREKVPDPKFIVLLRNPVDRAYSAWLTRRARGYEPLDFASAIEADLERIGRGPVFDGEDGPRLWVEGQVPVGELMLTSKEYRTYVDVGYYAQQLQRYLNMFPKKSFRLLRLSRLRQDPSGVTRELFEFLGLYSDVNTLDLRPLNVSLQKSAVRRALPGINVRRRLIDDMGAANSTGYQRTFMSREIRRFLLRHYAPHNRKLEELTGLDLSGWNE